MVGGINNTINSTKRLWQNNYILWDKIFRSHNRTVPTILPKMTVTYFRVLNNKYPHRPSPSRMALYRPYKVIIWCNLISITNHYMGRHNMCSMSKCNKKWVNLNPRFIKRSENSHKIRILMKMMRTGQKMIRMRRVCKDRGLIILFSNRGEGRDAKL
jgi:hypothetical protein